MSAFAKQIRNSVVMRLTQRDAQGRYPTLAGNRVLASRFTPIQSVEMMPLIIVSTPKVRSFTLSDGNAGLRFQSEVTLSLQVMVDAGSDVGVEDLLDDIDEQLATTLFQDPVWTSQMEAVTTITVEKTYHVEGDRRYGVLTRDCDVKITEAFEPDVDSPLEGVDLRINTLQLRDTTTHPDQGPDSKIDIGANIDLQEGTT